MSKRIIRDPKIMNGKPIIRGTRITVEAILKRLAEGLSVKEILEDYPYLKEEDIKAAILYAAKLLEEEAIISI